MGVENHRYCNGAPSRQDERVPSRMTLASVPFAEITRRSSASQASTGTSWVTCRSLYFITKAAAKMERKKEEPAPTTKACPYCDTQIPLKATRCAKPAVILPGAIP